MSDTDIVIAGGGITGLACACLLARQGHQISVIEAGPATVWQQQSSRSRVSAINLASRSLLEAAGVWQDIEQKRVSPYRAMKVWDSHSNARIGFDAAEYGIAALGYIVENDLLVESMQQRLAQNYNVKLLFDSAISDFASEDGKARVSVETRGDQHDISARLAIAADGGSSTLRRLAKIDVSEEDFAQSAIVATVSCSKHHQHTAWQCFTPEGPIAMLPLAGDHCSLVWSCDSGFAQHHLDNDAGGIETALREHFGPFLGELRLMDTPRSFILKNRHAQNYIGSCLALVGDAAHTTHPLAGLGANIGLLDAAALCEVIGNARDRGKSINSHATLRRYERWRRGENAVVLATMKGFKVLFGNVDPFLSRCRESGFSIADRVTPLKRQLAHYALGLSGDLPAVCRQGNLPRSGMRL